MAGQPCKECQEAPKAPGKHRCPECALRHEPIGVQVEAAKARLALAPLPHRSRVTAAEWPSGRRWCSGCQSMVSLRDVSSGGSRCRPCASAAAHGRHVEKAYGITPEQYDALLEAQGGRCALCGRQPKGKRLAVDHRHSDGQVRGLLCAGEMGCNVQVVGGIEAYAVDSPLAMAMRTTTYLAGESPGELLGLGGLAD